MIKLDLMEIQHQCSCGFQQTELMRAPEFSRMLREYPFFRNAICPVPGGKNVRWVYPSTHCASCRG